MDNIKKIVLILWLKTSASILFEDTIEITAEGNVANKGRRPNYEEIGYVQANSTMDSLFTCDENKLSFANFVKKKYLVNTFIVTWKPQLPLNKMRNYLECFIFYRCKFTNSI